MSYQFRRIEKAIEEDLKSKMVFISGPRQCGKTTISENFIKPNGAYYNWDAAKHRELIKAGKIDINKKIWIFDEIHKYKSWRNYLKGLYDLHHKEHKILVTGSAKLDYFKRGGDSLQGRYFFYRLHPFTLAEYLAKKNLNYIKAIEDLELNSSPKIQNALEKLMLLGAFPEPLLSNSERTAKRWRNLYAQRLIREDIRDLENVSDLDKLELLYEQLPNTVSSVLSINSLREDLEINFKTAANWLKILERNYAVFRLSPFGAPKIRAVKKEQKLYMWDSGIVADEAARLENLVALHLIRLVHWFEDYEGEKFELRYFRDTRGHEVDFIVIKNKKPWLAIEVKKTASSLDKNLKYLLERVKIPYAFQIHLNGDDSYRVPDINGSVVRIISAAQFLVNLP
ncbi:MAG: ATP-binding protein [Candidatus Caenarcaniphilales bacterium]|nr:ATP-binding protein [Candidatus Caenarcaniphilales bacterium]